MDKLAYFQQIGYEPFPEQLLFHNSDARFRVPSCGRRFGKSTMAARDRAPSLFEHKTRGWIVGPTYRLGEKEFRVFWDDLIIGQQLGKDKRVKKSYNTRQGDMYIELPWGARVEVVSADNADQLVGEQLDWVILSEAAKHKRETWERYIRPGLADSGGGADFPSTPEGHNWFYALWRLGQNPEFAQYASWKFPSWFNKAVFPGGRQDPEILQIEATTSFEWFMQEMGADFASFVGKIYGEFDESVHVRKVPYNPDWPNYMVLDWGFAAPLAAIEFQVDPWDNIHVWREWYQSHMRLEEHIAQWKQRENPEGWKIDCCFGDAEDPSSVQTVNQQWAPCVADPEAKKNWRQGIELVKRFLKLQEVGEADEYGTPKFEPSFFIDHTCENTIREFQTYRTKENARGREVTGSIVAHGSPDHALDAIRYGLMHLYVLGANRHLSEIYSGDLLDTPEDQEGYFTTAVRF